MQNGGLRLKRERKMKIKILIIYILCVCVCVREREREIDLLDTRGAKSKEKKERKWGDARELVIHVPSLI